MKQSERVDLLVTMHAELEGMRRERAEIVAGWETRRDLLIEAELMLRELMVVPEAWATAPAIAQLLIKIREELGLDPIEGST